MRVKHWAYLLTLTFASLLFSRYLGIIFTRVIFKLNDSIFFEKTTYKLLLAFFAISYMKRSDLSFSDFGFRRAQNFPYFKIGLFTLLFTVFIIPFNSIICFGILSKFLKSNHVYPNMGGSIVKIVLGILILSTFVEEVFVRGFFQSQLFDFKKRKLKLMKLDLSLSMFLSALLFSLMHVSNIFYGYDILFSVAMIANAFWLGLIAAYTREKYDSLYPAIYVHFIGNLVGIAPLIIKKIVATVG